MHEYISLNRIQKPFAVIDTTHVLTEKSAAHRLGIGPLRHFWFSETLGILRKALRGLNLHCYDWNLQWKWLPRDVHGWMTEPTVSGRATDRRRTLTSFWSLLCHLSIIWKTVKKSYKNARFFSENRLGNCVSFFKQDPKTPKMGTEYPAYNV